MRLAAAARAFDNLECLDAYTGYRLFYGQLGLYDDNKRDSETAERRVLSTEADIRLPTRGVIQAGGIRFILGHANTDFFRRGEPIRVSRPVHEAPELVRVRSLSQVVLDQQGFTAYAGRAWVKNNAFTEQSSALAPQHHIFFASCESIPDSSLLTFAGRLYVVRTKNVGAAGMLVTTCDELPEPSIEVGSIVSGGYDAVAESYSGSSTSIRILRMRWQSLFHYRNVAGPTFGPEDMQIALPKTVTVVPGAKLTLSDGVWYIASAADEYGVWLCRATRHA